MRITLSYGSNFQRVFTGSTFHKTNKKLMNSQTIKMKYTVPFEKYESQQDDFRWKSFC